MTPGETGAQLPPGTKLGRYVLGDEVGHGAMGVVYRAHDPRLDRDVAIKVLTHLHPDTEKRLLDEARVLATLSHPNVVRVFDVGTTNHVLFVAMEFVEGDRLDVWNLQRSPSERDRLRALDAAGRGLAAAHGAGIVHRGIKPSNVLVGANGRVRVADFGLALPAPVTLGDTESGESDARGASDSYIVGTPSYMAPEQHAGKTALPTADQYAFCVMATELLAGRRPFADLIG